MSAALGGGLVLLVFAFGCFWYAWGLDSGRQLVFTPFLVFALNEITRDWVAAVLSPAFGYSSSYAALWIELAAFVAFVVGFVLAFGVRRGVPGEAAELRARPISRVELSRAVPAIVFAGLILSAAGFYLYGGAPPVLLGLKGLLLEGSGLEAAAFVTDSREAITKGYYFGGDYHGQGALLKLMSIGWPILLASSLVLYRATKRWWLLLLSGVLLVATFVFVAGAGDRGPFLWSLVFVFLVGSFLFHVRYRTMAYAFAGLVVLAIGLSLYSLKLYNAIGSSDFLQQAFGKIISRIFLGNGVYTVQIIDLVRSGVWKLRYGQVLVSNMLDALPGVSVANVPLAYELYVYQNPLGKLTTYSTPTYFAEVFVDFGTLGACVLYFAFGVTIGLMQRWILQLPKSMLFLPLAGVVMLLLGRIPNVGISGLLAQVVVTVFFAVILAVCYQATRLFTSRPALAGPPPPLPVPE